MNIKKGKLSNKVSFYLYALIAILGFVSLVTGLGIQVYKNRVDKADLLAAGQTPSHNKLITPKGDGTYTISLDVTGDADPVIEAPRANVIVVFDTSNSMINNDVDNYVVQQYGIYGLVNGQYVQLYRRTGNGNNNYAALNTNNTVSTVYYHSGNGNNDASYTEYTGQRYNNTRPRRSDAAEKVIYDFAVSLFGYQDTTVTNPDNIQMSLITFNRNASIVLSGNGWTTNLNDITSRLSATGERGTSKLPNSSGTNYEAALRMTLDQLGTADGDQTFVIFVTDGAPSQVVGTPNNTYLNAADCYAASQDEARNIYLYDTKTHSYVGTEETRNTTIFGVYAYGDEADFLDDVIYYALNGYARPGGEHAGTDPTDQYYNASSSEALASAIAEIFEKIIDFLGITDVSIEDGTTSAVETTTGEISELLVVDESSFKYWLSIPVTNNKFTRTDPNTGDPVEYTVTDNNNGTFTITWGESNSVTVTGEYTGSAMSGTLKYQWTEANDLYQKAPPAATFENASVDWDLSSVGTLLSGVTYTITFDCYPSQTTNDIIADLKNGIIDYENDLDPVIKQYIERTGENGNYEYFLRTNTEATLKYRDSRTDSPIQTTTFTPPDPIETEPDQINMLKRWENQYDARKVESIDLSVNKDGVTYKNITLSENTNPKWTGGPVTIASGLMRVNYAADGTTITGIEVLTAGHDYTYNELGEEAYNWEMIAQTIHPMVINGTLKELILIDDAVTEQYTTANNPLAQYTYPDAMKNDTTRMFYQDGSHNYYRLESGSTKVYVETSITKPTIEAYNYRRSNLNIQKLVDGDSANPEDEFEFTIDVQDPGLNSGEDLWFSVYRNGEGCLDLDSQLNTSVWVKKVDDDDQQCHYYYHAAKSEGSFPTLVVKMRANDNLRFTNLTTQATFDVKETNKPDNYVYSKGEFKAWYGRESNEIPEDLKQVQFLDENREVKGEISLTNTSFYIYMTNTYKLVDVEVEKEFIDENNQDGIRPTTITVNLLGQNGEPVKDQNNENMTCEITINEDGKGTCKFEDLPRFDSEDNEIEYTVEEVAIETPTGHATGYEVGYVDARVTETTTDPETGDPITTIVTVGKFIWKINNTHTPETVDINVTKVWSDNNDQDGIRPNSVEVKLMNGNTVVGDPVELNEDGNWTYTWTGLDKYADGEEIPYTVVETETDVITGTDGPGTYAYEVTGSVEDGFTVTNTHTPETIEVKVTKVWVDNDDQDGFRPDTVEVKLMNGTTVVGDPVELDEDGNWTYTWTKLDKYAAGEVITYTVVETETDVITGTDGPGTYAYEVTGTQANGFTVTNTHTPETIEVKVTKVWVDNDDQDGFRPDTVEVQLMNGQTPVRDPVELDEDGSWTYTWTKLDKYADGEEITYTVVETETDVITGTDGPGTYAYEVTGTQANGFTVTNTHTPEIIEINVKKVWSDNNDQDGFRPTSVEVKLMNGDTVVGTPVTLNERGEWTYTWTKLDKYADGVEIPYTVVETETDVITGTDGPGTYAYKVTGTKEEGFTVTNTHTPEEITVKVTKVWDDADDQDGFRPDSVEVQLMNGQTPVGVPVDLDEAGNWTYTWTKLDKYADGVEIAYTVVETETDVITGTDGPGTYAYKVTGTKEEGFTVTNTHTPEETTVKVTKVWVDNDDQDGFRPTSVEVKLMNGQTPVGDPVELDEAGNWTYTWTKLDKYADGEEIAYTVVETETDVITGTDGPGTYAYEVTGTKEDGFTVTNTHTPEKTTVTVTKVWSDADDQDGKRPDSVEVKLMNGDTIVGTPVELDEAGNWTYTWTGLEKYADGKEIPYTVEETETDVITGTDGPGTYAYEVTGTKEDGFTVTNTHTPETIEVTVEKVWDDKADQDRIRPTSVDIQLMIDETTVGKPVTLNEDNTWTYTWTKIDKYADGELVEYTVTEIETRVITGEDTATTYKYEITGDQTTGYVVTNTHTPETTEVSVKKVWDDKDDQDGIRPTNVKIQLKKNDSNLGDPVTLSDDNNWSYTWEGLDKNLAGVLVEYTVEEVTTDVITGEDEHGTYSFEVSGSQSNGYVVTNTHTPDVKNIEGTKTWDDANNQDGKRPESITVKLLADGEVYDTVTVTEDDNWAYIFEDVPVYKDGVEIVYTIDEAAVDGYSTTINGFDITNSYTPEITNVNGVKTWDDANNQDGKRPESIIVQLKANGEVIDSVTVTASNNWSYSFTGLPKYSDGTVIVYSVDEETVPDGYEKSISGFNITNTYEPETINIEGTKTWDDANDQDGKRPTSITVILKANGEEYRRTTVGASNNWSYSFTDVPVYKDGTKIVYTVDEETVPEGYKKSIAGYDITNTHTPETTSVSGEKIWDDADDQDGKRPTSITIKLLADGKQVDSVTITEDDDWAYSFTDLPKYSKGKEISYTIDEVDVPDYETTYDGYNITNKYVPETISVSANKVWDDDNDRDKVRPTTIQYNLLVGDEIKLSKEVTSDDNWAYTFSNLPKYSKGVEIVYTVTETPVDKYTTTVSGDAAKGFTFTNSYTPEKTSVSGVKVWDDADNQDGKRPTSITITLYGNDEKVESKSVTSADNWAFTFDNLPKYDQGVEIGYTIKETEITGYETEITGNFKEGYTVTNKHIPTTVTINGEKSWVDSNDKDGLRPTSITVNLKANGEVVDTVTVTEADEWKYTFADKPEYEKGSKITYTVEEVAVEHYETTYDGYSIVNTHNPKDVTVEGVKTWDDDDNIYGRPESITVRLTGKKGDEVIITDSKIVTAEDEWKYSFTGLPEYKDGVLITYSISEDDVLDYSTTYDGYNIKNTYTPKTVDFAGEKIWDDADDQDGKRQESITINLLADGEVVDTAIVSEETEWKFAFTGKVYYANGKKIEYTIEEVKVEGYETGLETETDEETGNITFSITNTHTPEKVSFKVTKQWADEDNYDDIRPDTLTVYLYKTVKGTRTKVKEQTISGPEWTYEFIDLPKYENGNLITYDISEEEVAGYTSTIEDAVIVNDNNITQLIINTHEPELSISGTKTWEDDDNRDGARPGTITVYLYADGELIGTKEVSEDTEWYYEFTDLKVFNNHVEIEYTIEEKPVDNYETTYDGYDITNTHEIETVDFDGSKTWDDKDNQDGIRPDSITVNLYADGTLLKSITVTEEDEWTYSFTNLPKYRDGGVEIVYTIDEDPVEGYKATYNGFDITNTHVPETIELTITKFWIDEDDKDGLRPDSILVSIYGNGEFVTEVEITGEELTDDGDWTYTINDLPKYKDGEKLTYTIEEKVIEGYFAVYNERDYGYEIVNVHTPETGDTDIIDPPNTNVETVNVINNPLENVVLYDDKKKYWMM